MYGGHVIGDVSYCGTNDVFGTFCAIYWVLGQTEIPVKTLPFFCTFSWNYWWPRILCYWWFLSSLTQKRTFPRQFTAIYPDNNKPEFTNLWNSVDNNNHTLTTIIQTTTIIIILIQWDLSFVFFQNGIGGTVIVKLSYTQKESYTPKVAKQNQKLSVINHGYYLDLCTIDSK